MAWNPQQYLKFETQRTRPAIDLVQRLAPDRAEIMADLGCGPGNSTEVLRSRWPQAHVIGVDSSASMIDQARARVPGGDWRVGDLSDWGAPASFDVVLANASLQWVPDHERLLPRLLSLVRPGGELAVQVPAYHEMPVAHAVDRVFQQLFPSRSLTLASFMRFHSFDVYYDILSRTGRPFDLWQTAYVHPLPSAEDVYRMIESTGVRPYLEALSTESERSLFEREVLKALTNLFPSRADGRVLFPFQRIFFIVRA